MPETNEEELEKTWNAEDPDEPRFPDEEIGEELPEEEEKGVKTIEEPFFSEEELTEEEQPSLFAGDRVYNELQISLKDIKESLKRNKKKLAAVQLEKEIYERREKEILEAIEDYEKQRQEAE